MTTAFSFPHDELLAFVVLSLCTRPLGGFAQESRLDGESLKDAVERYEVDYAWHVLGSERLLNETIALLEARLEQAASDLLKARVAELLKAAAARQPAELLMSFDNDVSEALAARLFAWIRRTEHSEAEALN